MSILVPCGESLKAFLKEYFDENKPHCGNCRKWKLRNGGMLIGMMMLCDKKGRNSGRGFNEWDCCRRHIFKVKP